MSDIDPTKAPFCRVTPTDSELIGAAWRAWNTEMPKPCELSLAGFIRYASDRNYSEGVFLQGFRAGYAEAQKQQEDAK